MVEQYMTEFDFARIEKKWQGKWEKAKVFEVSEKSKKEKYYVLEMFPYPSGDGLHMGHAWNYTIGDILARFKIMKGFNVLHPMGYDSLGLPAENAAIENGEHPEDYTKKSVKHFMAQQKALGLSYDWTRILSSHDSSYYKWDQWIFLKMLEKGLAYQKVSAVNWCRECNSVLANEQVHDGKCWRHMDVGVEVRYLKQWFLKTTEYADELYGGLDKLNWPERTKAMQRNWIGKSHGTEIDFVVGGGNKQDEQDRQENSIWPIFTTRPDTIFGVTFMVVSAQHPRLNKLVTVEQRKEVDLFLKKLKSVSEKDVRDLEKEGVFTGSYAINPANEERVPIWAGNFIVADYGAGMVMAVPAHDQRDFEFAKKYGIEIKQVVGCPKNYDWKKGAYTDWGNLINSGEFNGLDNVDAKKKITDWLIKKKVGRKVVNFKLRDWGISRQRYWGTPIPVVHCEKCGVVSVPEKDLPVELPKKVRFGKGNPLETAKDWLNIKCPKCGEKGRRESDTMDTFVNSSWYFLRYCDPKNDKKIFDSKKVKYWCPVDTYVGGAEHACMHLIYSRFYVKFLRDLGLINFDEPTVRLFHQGMLRAEGGVKMSKSKPETCVLPEIVSDKYGIDTARFFLSSLASPDKDIDWSEKGISGSSRFTKRIFEFFEKFMGGKDSEELLSKLNRTIKNVSIYYENFEYRKATIEIRELFDLIEKNNVSKDTLGKFLQLLNPICPHITEELWEKIGYKEFISTSIWPKVDERRVLKKGQYGGDLNDKIIERVKGILKEDTKNVYVYVMPFEIEKIDVMKISNGVCKPVKVFAVNDSKKIDPENKARKAKPGMASIYFK
jgi:leucyl-tRNA synthetase